MSAAPKFKRFDVRPVLAAGQDPLPAIRARVRGLKPREGLLIIAPFLPSPLIELLGSQGFASRVERGTRGEWSVFFWRASNEKGDSSCKH
jgi:hypothetical protein